MQLLKLAAMLARERLSPPRVARRPEPTATMDDEAQVAAFHAQGATDFLPIYHFNALAVSRLVPEGGTVLDLGSGSAQYLAYLARCRPDVRIIGLDLAPRMVETGRRMLTEEGLADRVDLRVGDMTRFSDLIVGDIHLVSSVFSLHHLPDQQHLLACLGEMRCLRSRTGCGVWIFDHVRPRHPSTPALFPDLFTPNAPAAFNRDSTNSLIASFSFDELSACILESGLRGGEHWAARWLNLYQVLSLPGPVSSPGSSTLWHGPTLPPVARKNLAGLQRLFPACPNDER